MDYNKLCDKCKRRLDREHSTSGQRLQKQLNNWKPTGEPITETFDNNYTEALLNELEQAAMETAEHLEQ